MRRSLNEDVVAVWVRFTQVIVKPSDDVSGLIVVDVVNDLCDPWQCHIYSFWPGIVKRRKTWSDESRRCEGIDRGAPVAMKLIKTAVPECGI
jgi:hypothetical protein